MNFYQIILYTKGQWRTNVEGMNVELIQIVIKLFYIDRSFSGTSIKFIMKLKQKQQNSKNERVTNRFF